mmetsp:Transcript_23154/g.52909  ORF Transcript_23154/g.52909 Transcript_23154/m.52909 type:complete len:465 (-) Transcript_23154:255-1649(-)
MIFLVLKAVPFFLLILQNVEAKFVEVTGFEPVLGRGYSTSTGKQFGSCIRPQSYNTPIIDYSYFWAEIDSATSAEDGLSGKMSTTKSLGYLIEEISADRKGGISLQHIILVLMFEHNGLTFTDENVSLKTDVASWATDNDKLFDFFTVCGPGYIRTIKKVAELAVIFAYPTEFGEWSPDYNNAIITDTESAINMADNVGGYDEGPFRLTDMWQYAWDLRIRMRAIGMNMPEDSGYMLDMTMNGLPVSMLHAFKAMRDDGAGVVAGIDVVPWTDHLSSLHSFSTFEAHTLSLNAEFLSSLNDVLKKKTALAETAMRCKIEVSREYLSSGQTLLGNRQITAHSLAGSYTCETAAATAISANDLLFMNVNRLNDLFKGVIITTYMARLQSYITHVYQSCTTALKNDFTDRIWFDIPECNNMECLRVDSDASENAGVVTCIQEETETVNFIKLVESFCPIILTSLSCS